MRIFRSLGNRHLDTNAELTRLREHMVSNQLEQRGIHDSRVLEAMRTVPRHRFVPLSCRDRAYDDRPLGIGRGQTISQPYMVALMTALLELSEGGHVLEIGTGSGYQTAVLAEIAERVDTVERVPELAAGAQALLEELGYENAHVHTGDGTVGYPEEAPYDGIIVTAAAPRVPPALKTQLRDGGRLVCPAGDRSTQRLVTLVRSGSDFAEQRGTGCVFVPLIGEEGWEE